MAPLGSRPSLRNCGRFEKGLLNHLRSKHQDLLDWLTKDDPKIKGEPADRIKAALDEYAEGFS